MDIGNISVAMGNPIRTYNIPSVSNRVLEAIKKGMAFEAKDRSQSVQDWLELLLRTSAGIPQPQRAKNLQPQVTPSPLPADDLSSDKGVDYQKLRDLLKAGNWREADLETARVMLKVAGREKKGWFNAQHIEKFPCTDLRTIDRLWVKYSNGRFGFSVQKRIWESVGGKPGEWDREIQDEFCDRVGWSEMKNN